MARDGFSREVIDRLAKRVGHRCSYPDCRLPTAGPDAAEGVTNTGVDAHIAAASPGGARYDETMTPEQRAAFTNGIWLCQVHAKLIDDDELTYSVPRLLDWKATAEAMASLEAKGFEVRRARSFQELEKKAPKLLAEMRKDILSHPLWREFILLRNRRIMYNSGDTPHFTYFYEDHPELGALVTILKHHGAIYDVTFNGVPRYNFGEDFVEYLLGADIS